MLILAKLNISSREMAQMLGISMDSLRKARYRLRKKLNIEDDADFNSISRDL